MRENKEAANVREAVQIEITTLELAPMEANITRRRRRRVQRKHGELWLHNYAAWLSPRGRIRPNSATLNAHAAGAGRGLVEHPLEPAAAITHCHHHNCGN